MNKNKEEKRKRNNKGKHGGKRKEQVRHKKWRNYTVIENLYR